MSLTKVQFFGMYIGSKVKYGESKWLQSEIIGVDKNFIIVDCGKIDFLPKPKPINDCQLILRRVEDITEKELEKLKQFDPVFINQNWGEIMAGDAMRTDYLRSIGVEPNEFYWEQGWCIRKKSMK